MALKTPFLTGLLALLPEDERGKAEAGLEEIEKAQLRQEDYSRLSNETAAEKKKFEDLYGSNVTWFESKKAELAELDDLRKKVTGGTGDPAKPVVATPTAVTKEEFEATLAATERGALGFIAESNALTLKHYQQFGEILDIRELLADKRIQQIGIQGVYADRFKDQIKAKVDAAQATRDEALRKEGEERVRATQRGQHQAYPVRGNEPSTLDALDAVGGKAPAVKSVDEMAGEYERLGTTRSGAV